MAKRNQAKFASKSRKSALRIEALEQRQLLAAVTGGGTQVGSDIVHPNGNTYDQVLMTGSSVTVTADAGQVTRISYIDLSGDIVQAEFSGKGTLTVSLDQFTGAAPAANYNQPGVNYVSGLATFTIQGEDASTNFSVFSVGSGNAVNQDLFAGGKTGGNNYADVARLLIVADPANPGGFSTMGGIRAGNAVFSDISGVVGISAANVNTQGPVIIGDIDAKNAGVPSLRFGKDSQFATLVVAGGDLLQTNATPVNNEGFQDINSVDGTTSAGTTVRAQTIPNTVGPGGTFQTALTGGVVTIDTISSYDLTGKTQADIDAAFKGRTFINAITISGDLSGVNTLTAAEFRGALTFTGTLTGDVTVTGAVKSLTLQKVNGDTIKAASFGAISTTGTADLAGTIKAQSIGVVTVGGNSTGVITTDYDGNTVWTSGEKAVGDVNVTGSLSGQIFGVLGIGNVTVGGNLTTSGATDIALRTSSGTSGDSFLGNIGKVAVTGDVSQGTAGAALIKIGVNGTFGDITVGGAGTNTGAHNVGTISVAGVLGAAGTTAGKITVTDNTNATTALTLGAISIGASTAANGSLGAISLTNTTGNVESSTISFNGTGSVGDVTVTGSGAKNSTAKLGAITLSTGTGGVSVGNISVTNAELVSMTGATGAKAIGNFKATAVNATGATQSVTTAAISADNGGAATIGTVTLDATSTGTVTIGGDIATVNFASGATSSIGSVSINGSTIAFNNSVKAASVGAVSLTGATTFADGKGISALKGLTSFTAVGNTTFTNTTGTNIRVGGSTGANFSFTGNTTFTGGTAPAILADNGSSALDALGNLTFNGKVAGNTGIEIRASSIGDITVTSALTTLDSLVTDFNVYAGNNAGTSAGTTEAVKLDGSNLASFSIGNVSITSTNSIGIAATSLLTGANSINALGKIGNVSLIAGGSAAVQTPLFSTGTSSLVVQTGNGSLTGNAVNVTGTGIDFDGNGSTTTQTFDTNITAANESSSQFSTSTTASIGNITVNAKFGATTDSIQSLGGAGGAVDGLMVLSAVKGAAGDIKPTNVTAVNGNLRGTVGNVLLTNLSQQLSVQAAQGTPAGYGTVDLSGLIAATAGTSSVSPYGTIQGLAATSAGLVLTNNTVMVGTVVANTGHPDTLVVIRL